ncbi:hypothetical protein GGR51DRAFT_566191 [Nemania sp. FL0031]|nr:hypothetical protein GGR51DRAFT_566191 [Nemania sp. FL0031]
MPSVLSARRCRADRARLQLRQRLQVLQLEQRWCEATPFPLGEDDNEDDDDDDEKEDEDDEDGDEDKVENKDEDKDEDDDNDNDETDWLGASFARLSRFDSYYCRGPIVDKGEDNFPQTTSQKWNAYVNDDPPDYGRFTRTMKKSKYKLE